MSPAVKLLRVALPWSLSAERAALLVRGDRRPFALSGRWAGGGALIGSEPVRVAEPGADPFALLDEQPEVDPETGPAAPGQDPGVVGGGWFGYLGYPLSRRLEPVGASPPGPPGPHPPAFALAFYDHLLRLDRHGRWWFEALCAEPRAPIIQGRLELLRRRAEGDGVPPAGPQPRPFATEPWRTLPGDGGHQLAVRACRERIHRGDLFQANICVRLGSRLRGDPIDLFAAGVAALAPDRAAFLAGPWGAVASLSPELFLERRGRRVRSAPIKGTRRMQDPGARGELERSPKDRAENVMIVDLVRNDLGRVCRPGSVAVDVLASARPHTGVWHLVSEVSGDLRAGVGDGELVRAAFPPGSVTGAPKVAALNVIAELESSPRHVYTGAIGFASPLAGLELSVAIRTFEFAGGRAWLGVGGGIVADSDAAAEAREAATKARPLLAAIGAEPIAELPEPIATNGARVPLRLGPRPTPRPDPDAGVFETLRVRDRRPLVLDRHLARIAASAQALYGRPLPADLRRRLTEAAASGETAHARLRVDLRPDGAGGLSVAITRSPLAARVVPVRLVPVTVPGGLGAHKWSDRRLLDALRAGSGRPGGEPLLCDLDGLVLECARANVFAVAGDGALLTPPLDGRILRGVTRERVLRLAAARGVLLRVAPLSLVALAGAKELFVTGALGGVEAAQLDGHPPGASSLAGALAAGLAALSADPRAGDT